MNSWLFEKLHFLAGVGVVPRFDNWRNFHPLYRGLQRTHYFIGRAGYF